MDTYFEDPLSHLTRAQITILAGRNLDQLDAFEKLCFANAAAKPRIEKSEIAEAFKFRADPGRLSATTARQRLSVANEGETLGRLRQEIHHLQTAAEHESEIASRENLLAKVIELRRAAGLIYAGIAHLEALPLTTAS